jgi:DNA-binding IclR family transcriptional regulator
MVLRDGKKARPPGRGVQSIEVGGRLLSAMVNAGGAAMLRDLAQAADMAPAQAHAYLRSFQNVGLVEQDRDTGLYGLGAFALQLGMTRLRTFDPLRMAGQTAVALSSELGLMVAVLVWGTYGPTVVQVQEGSDQLHVNVRAGTVFTLTGTASGAVFTAFMKGAAVKSLLQRELKLGSRTQRIGTPARPDAVAAVVNDVRKLGYATTEGRPVPGVNAISAPVFDRTGQIQCAITLIGPTAALPLDGDDKLAARLLDATHDLSRQLGWSETEVRLQGRSDKEAATRRTIP